MDLYQDLKDKVTAAGFTMQAVCIKAGISTGTPSHWAAGRVKPSKNTHAVLMHTIRQMVAERDANMHAAGVRVDNVAPLTR